MSDLPTPPYVDIGFPKAGFNRPMLVTHASQALVNGEPASVLVGVVILHDGCSASRRALRWGAEQADESAITLTGRNIVIGENELLILDREG
jgi:hypothetical protein